MSDTLVAVRRRPLLALPGVRRRSVTLLMVRRRPSRGVPGDLPLGVRRRGVVSFFLLRDLGMVEPVDRRLGRMTDAMLWITSSVPVVVLPLYCRPTLPTQPHRQTGTNGTRGAAGTGAGTYRLSAWELMRPSPLRNRSAYTPV